MPRSYRHINEYGDVILRLKAEGKTKREIGEILGVFFELSVQIGAVQFACMALFSQKIEEDSSIAYEKGDQSVISSHTKALCSTGSGTEAPPIRQASP